MKSMKQSFGAAMALAVAVVAMAAAQGSYRLEYKFQKGQTHLYRSVSANDITQEMQGQEMKSTNDARSVVRFVVDNVTNDGSMVLVVSADSMFNRTKNVYMDTTISMKNMIGKRVKLTIDKSGKVQSREILDSLQYDLAGMNTRTPQREVMNVLVLPQKDLKVGDKWTDSKNDTVDVGTGKMVNTTDMEYALVGTEARSGHQCLKIAYTGKVVTSGKMNRMGMDLFTEGTGKITGTLYFDHAKGILVSDESARDIESTIAVTGQQNMTIPMTTSSKSTVELLGD